MMKIVVVMSKGSPRMDRGFMMMLVAAVFFFLVGGKWKRQESETIRRC